MKKEWFEPGPDGVSPFEREMQKEWRTTNIPKGISAAFRALLAESEGAQVATPPAVELRVGDVVRLEVWEGFNDSAMYEGRQGTVIRIGTNEDFGRVQTDIPCWFKHLGTMYWPVSALTLIRRAGEVDGKQDDEIVGLRAEVERLRNERDASEAETKRLQGELQQCNHMNRGLTAERDALQARIAELQDQSRTWHSTSNNWKIAHEQAQHRLTAIMEGRDND